MELTIFFSLYTHIKGCTYIQDVHSYLFIYLLGDENRVKDLNDQSYNDFETDVMAIATCSFLLYRREKEKTKRKINVLANLYF